MIKRVAIHSVPRSGSTWLGTIFDSHPDVIYRYQPLFSYAFKSYLNENSTSEEIEEFFHLISKSKDGFINQEHAKKSGIIPSFKKGSNNEAIIYKEVRYHHIIENLITKCPDLKIIGLIRDPRATINSWLRAPKEFRKDKDWDQKVEWLYANKKNEGKAEEFNGFQKWKEVAFLFERLNTEYPEQFILLRYSDLLKDTEVVTQDIFDKIGLKTPSETFDFIKKSKEVSNNDAYSVYRKKDSDEKWCSELDNEIRKEIELDLKNTSLEKWLDI